MVAVLVRAPNAGGRRCRGVLLLLGSFAGHLSLYTRRRSCSRWPAHQVYVARTEVSPVRLAHELAGKPCPLAAAVYAAALPHLGRMPR